MLRDIVIDVVTNEAVLGFAVAIAAVVIYRLVAQRLPEKALRIVADTFQFIEDHYREWNIFGSEKMARLVQIFIDKFREEYNKPPTPEQVGMAVKLAEKMVAAQKNSQTG